MIKRFSLLKGAIFMSLGWLLTSCIDIDNSLGKNLVPGEYEMKIEETEFNLPIETKMLDSLQTISNLKTSPLTQQFASIITETDHLVIGSFFDPDLGNSSSEGIIQLLPDSRYNKATFGESPELVSIYMYLPVNNSLTFHEGDRNAPQNLRVYRVLTDLDSTKIYSNSISDTDIDNSPISYGSNLYLGDKMIKIKLSDKFAKELLSVKSEDMDSINFLKIFKGFTIKTDPQPLNMRGGRYNLVSPYRSYIELIYKHKDAVKKIDKDSSLIYSFGYNSVNYWLNRYKHSSASMASSNEERYIYLEGLAGIKPYIDFNKVKSLMDEWLSKKQLDPKRTIILNAKIVMPFEAPDDYKESFYFPSTICLSAKTNHTKERAIFDNISNVNIGTAPKSGNGKINLSLTSYSINVSNYIQDLMIEKISSTQKKCYILPMLSTFDSRSGKESSLTIDNRKYCKIRLNGPKHENKPVLRITYTVK